MAMADMLIFATAAPEDYLQQPAAPAGQLPAGPARDAWQQLQKQTGVSAGLNEGSAYWLSLWIPASSLQACSYVYASL